MQIPDGRECPHYYEDMNRHTRDIQECRLVKANPNSNPWRPHDCSKCPVPDILQANASPDMKLTIEIKSSMFGLMRRVDVLAHCTKHNIAIPDPYTGCPENHHPGLDLFRQALEDSNE